MHPPPPFPLIFNLLTYFFYSAVLLFVIKNMNTACFAFEANRKRYTGSTKSSLFRPKCCIRRDCRCIFVDSANGLFGQSWELESDFVDDEELEEGVSSNKRRRATQDVFILFPSRRVFRQYLGDAAILNVKFVGCCYPECEVRSRAAAGQELGRSRHHGF
jgi:hypothetical protein